MDKVAVFGLGFVGLPLALSFAMRGCKVIGIDVDPSLVEDLNNGLTHHLESYQGRSIQEMLGDELASGRFRATLDCTEALEECTNIIVTVGVPVDKGEHDLTPVTTVCRSIASGLKPGDLVLIRSTLIPGTTRQVILPILEESGMKAGEDFFLGYSSERIAEGRAFHEFENMPAAVSGINEPSLDKAHALISIVTKAEITRGSQIEVVEAAKVMENISRDVDIAMSQEFARFARALGIDIFEVIKVANTHLRVNLLTPGPGVGGYCLPNALYYLLPKAEEMGMELPLLTMARQTNDLVPLLVAEMALKNLPVPAAQACVGVLGLAMKDYSNDDRISPARDVIHHLQKAGCQVMAFDPAVPSYYPYKVDSLEEAVAGAHGILILALQNDIDYHNLSLFKENLVGPQPFIVDTKNIYQRSEVESYGLKLETI
ncbi:MAG: nucleotide sugar dehydrogenase [Syntrophomonadaceae bacterium]|nr:nucleotide sugar dehydrogenase [Syntrophomonadaceae bacterium]